MKEAAKSILKRLTSFYSSIYGQVVMIIAILSVFLFIAFNVITKNVNKEYMESEIQQSGNNVCLLVEGALYQYMLENDKTALRNMLNIINEMPGIEDVNMYDSENNLVNSSFSEESSGHDDPNCIDCHDDLNTMFPIDEKTYKIINIDYKCRCMAEKHYDTRLLMIKSPILNQRSCYTSACHAHSPDEKVLGSFIIRIPLEELDTNLNKSYLFAILTTIIIAILVVIFTRIKIRKPLLAIVKASEAVSRGKKDTRLEIKPHQLNDIRLVSKAFNEMLDNIHNATIELKNWSQQLEYKVQKKSKELSEIQKELMHVERIASLGKLSSSVAHEINNPLSGVLTYTKLIQKQFNKIDLDQALKEPIIKYLKIIETETKRCGEIVKGLLNFSRKDQQDFEIRHLHEILEDTYSLMSHQMKISNINLITEFNSKHDLIYCSDNQIKQACVAVLLNAAEAIIENGDIIMRTTNPNDESIKLEIIDNGVGIDPEDIMHIFEPFFSAKQKTSGIGLGLAIVHGIVKSHDGYIEAESELGKSTTISIILPLIKN